MTKRSSTKKHSLMQREQRRARNEQLRAALALAAALAPLGLQVQHARADSGNYANVNDALQGQTYALRSDDLLLSFGGEDPDVSGAREAWLSTISNTDDGTPFQSFASANNATECNYLQRPNPCNWYFPAYNNEVTPVSGRFFESDKDAVVQFTNIRQDVNANPIGLYYDFVTLVAGTDSNGNAIAEYTTRQPVPYGVNETTNARPVVADWNGDGFDEIAMVYSDSAMNFYGNARLRFATPGSRTDPSQWWTFGPEFANDQIGINYQIHAAVAADVNGDGRPELALLYVNNDTLQLTLAIFSISTDLQPTFQGSVVVDTLAQTAPDEAMDLAAGAFTTSNAQQLVVVNRNGGENYNAVVRVFDTNGGYTPALKGSLDTKFPLNRLKLVAGRMSWSDSVDSLALMLTNVAGGKSSTSVWALSVDPDSLTPMQAATLNPIADMYKNDKSHVVLDIALGNYNRHDFFVDQIGPRNPDQQIAVVVGQTKDRNDRGELQYALNGLAYYDSNRDGNGQLSFQLGWQMGTLVDGDGATNDVVTSAKLVPADLHGRSLRLGNPQKIEIDRQNATMILGQPPMHVDWAAADKDASTTFLNLSYAPDRFTASYTTSSSSSNSVQNTQSKGWGFSGKESVSGTFSETMGEGLVAENIEVKDTLTAEQEINRSTDHKYGTVTTEETDVSSSTLGNDEVWFEDGTSYIYVYDVIGKTICPDGGASCDASQRIPLTMMLSAPGAVTTNHTSAESLEWYQPPWENGNILSYPGNAAQLLASVDQPQVLNQATSFATTNDNTSWSTKWSVTTSDETDVTSSNVFKESNDFSTEVGGKIGPVGFKASYDIDVGASQSFGSLRASSTTSTQAQGVSLTKNLQFRDPSDLAYNFSPVIYGDGQPGSYSDVPSSDSGVNVFGPLRTGYWVDLFSTNAPIQTFIEQNYGSKPDVALNHPNRRGFAKSSSGTGLPSNCVETTDGYADCATMNKRTPDDPWNDTFHHMRGFFVSRINPTTGATGAPQQSMTAGDKMQLSARVYNYSIKAMDPNTKVYVDFYAMPWDTGTGSPTIEGGGSTWIGTTTIGAIPPFSQTGSTQNYSMASVNFDTTTWSGKHLLFWVLVWADNADGTMLAEQAGKGLSAIPTSTPINSYLEALALEPTLTNNWKTNDDDPTLTSFSNNIGVYKQLYYVAPMVNAQNLLGTKAGQVADGVSKTPGEELAGLSVPALAMSRNSLKLGESTEVHGILHNNSDAVESFAAYFFDGDPAKGGQLFDVDRYPHVDANADHKISTDFTPKSCGDHEVYLQLVRKGVKTAAAEPVEKVTVTCPSPAKHTSHDDDGGCSVGHDGGNANLGWFVSLFGMGLIRSARRKRALAKGQAR